ncbi:DUF2188 domain-containing protein [Legionella israelensis]|nr:DUF2188 domain-containing protein [Legionella israelensis]
MKLMKGKCYSKINDLKKEKRMEAYHVFPHETKGWEVRKTNARAASGYFKTKQAAIDSARALSQAEGIELFIHDRKNKIDEKR